MELKKNNNNNVFRKQTEKKIFWKICKDGGKVLPFLEHLKEVWNSA